MTSPDHITRLIALDPSETSSGFDAPEQSARMQQHFETPQGAAERAEAARVASDSLSTAFRVLACALIALIVVLIFWLSLPWIAERAAADAAIAPQMMRF